ncbi:MAG: decarboxylase [Clostridium sp.]|nr:decarboxylase [Clostridium sp.]
MKLIDRLKEYGKSDFYAFHMPGHKRQEELEITLFPNPFSVDITEIDGFDNLHHPEGILKESMERAAAVYGADRTYYLVNGSTCGILAAISSAVSDGKKLLMARNSHKSAYHAAMLNRMETEYIYPEIIEESGIQGGIEPGELRRILEADKENRIGAVFLTSPTYEGIVSDIKNLAEIVHERGIPLIVDEAHGAHFAFYEGEGENRQTGRLFPRSALQCGADLVIQSIHKTLPSLTQTAVLHLKEGIADRERLEFYLRIYQSSSPSYVMMASIDNCIEYMAGEGRKRLEQLGRRLEHWMEDAKQWSCLRVLDDHVLEENGAFDRDISKLVVGISPQAEKAGINGTALAEAVRRRFHLEPEMCCDRYVLYMTSLMDSEESLFKLSAALTQIDKEIAGALCMGRNEGTEGISEEMEKHSGKQGTLTWTRDVPRRISMAEAVNKKGRRIRLEDACGCISRGFLTVYPPGVPAVVPGEMISQETAELLLKNAGLGLTVEGLDSDGSIDAVKDE